MLGDSVIEESVEKEVGGEAGFAEESELAEESEQEFGEVLRIEQFRGFQLIFAMEFD